MVIGSDANGSVRLVPNLISGLPKDGARRGMTVMVLGSVVTIMFVGVVTGILRFSHLLAATQNKCGLPNKSSMFSGMLSKPKTSEITAPLRVNLFIKGRIEFDRPVRLLLKVEPIRDLLDIDQIEATIQLPEGVKHLKGKIKGVWKGAFRKGSTRELMVDILITKDIVTSKEAPIIFGGATVSKRDIRLSSTAALYLLIVDGKLEVTNSLSIEVSHSLHGSFKLNEPLQLVTEIVSPVDLPNVKFTIELPEGVELLSGNLKGQISLLKQHPQKVSVTIKVTKVGRWVIGSYFEGKRGGFVFQGSGDLTMVASEDGSLRIEYPRRLE
jgi:hypothetical protein